MKYGNKSGNSGVESYDYDETTITVRFSDGGTYVYGAPVLDARTLAEMKQRAADGRGLNTLINQRVRKRYLRKL